MIQVLVADDHAIVRDGLRRLLHTTPDLRVIAEVDNGADAVGAAADTTAQVAVVDLSLPHIGGLELVKAMCAARPQLRLVIFSMHPEDKLAAHIIRAGASAYVCKDRPLTDLITAIRAAAAGERYVSDALAALVEASTAGDAPHRSFSAREAQVFDGLLAGRSVGEIAASLEINGSTASNHLARIREKLGVSTNAEVLIYAHRAGLLS